MLPGLRKISVLTSLLCIAAIAVFFNSSRNLSVFSLGSHKSSLCSCHKCLTDGDPRFTEINTSSPKPFLSRKIMISEDDFNWWKRIYSERYNFSFYNATVVNIFKTFPPVPDVVEASPDRCRTCAVVGNSGNLKGSHYGPLIDFHDVIIRINRGRTKGFEADVGKRTTHHVMYPESAVPLDNTTHLVLVPFKIKDLLWLLQKFNQGENSAVNSKRMANKDLVMILSPAFMKYVHEIWLSKNGSYPSTGFLTFALSMFICDEVSVFGFGANKDGNWDHYFETLKNKHLRTGAHAGSHEYDVIQQLHKKQKIQFFKGW
ncbi:CMP-N-acetylneuraminate-beta-galactosamide-alpha-2,3-sialyltransferase 1-like [Seriola lalandi dorsalis]|uniref:CMP-N-acetylneuraminate-beta-galactosamide-alpha-2,3-sialyltransferase 1 n=1 Tax=Seriola lalandi dorsalis TaxID=1841481 RepID=A0A3B4WUR6_SERLL|nr:CMP-N-acetylneuraminate-beta-galactosamide-alpha-2,3-sialyltransferase 1-like [Seriola lalandi dorsalis]XP_056254562.1 CMP-N-acetylneuraminate-beta-galactosamide-alpha-2,3-sialyltransferase 1-like [Seriola aureovittata]